MLSLMKGKKLRKLPNYCLHYFYYSFNVLICFSCVQGCPLWDSNEYTEHERRQLLIARLPNVEMLNGGGSIEHDEREDAERAFIRYYIDKPESDRPDRYWFRYLQTLLKIS